MVWHFYVLTISIVSDASFRESPLQTGVKTDSFTGSLLAEVSHDERPLLAGTFTGISSN